MLTGTSQVTIPTTATGDLVAVIVSWPGTAAETTHVKVGYYQFARMGGQPPVDPCGASSEVWISGLASGGWAPASVVLVERNDAAPYVVDVVELSGVDLLYDWKLGQPTAAPGSGAPVASDPGGVVLSTITTCGTVNSLAASSPFTVLALDHAGTSSALDIPAEPGRYTPVWVYDGGASNTLTASFQ